MARQAWAVRGEKGARRIRRISGKNGNARDVRSVREKDQGGSFTWACVARRGRKGTLVRGWLLPSRRPRYTGQNTALDDHSPAPDGIGSAIPDGNAS